MTGKTNFIDTQISLRVKMLRTAASVSESDAAFVIGVSLEDYAALESGVKRFNPRDLFTLAVEFGVEMREFFDNTSEPEAIQLGASNVIPLFPYIQ